MQDKQGTMTAFLLENEKSCKSEPWANAKSQNRRRGISIPSQWNGPTQLENRH